MKVFDRYIWKAVDGAIFCAVFGMVVLIATQVATRVFGHSAPWTEELSRFLFIWTTFLGMATGFRYGNHPSMELLLGCFPNAVVRILRYLTPACAVVFFGIVCWFGLILIHQQIRYGEISPSLQVGMWVTTLPLILGSALAPIGAILHTLWPEDSETEQSPEEPA